MDQDKAAYIIKYFPRLLSIAERTAWWHHFAMSKIEQIPAGMEGSEAEAWQRSKISFYKEQDFISQDAGVQALLEDGFEQFELRAGQRILADDPQEVYLNNCPKCEKLARTPQSKQCRYCGHSWHETVGATFDHKGTREHNSKPGFLVFEGEIIKGEIGTGLLVDLTYYGINLKPEIEGVQVFNATSVSFDFYIDSEVVRNLLLGAGQNIEPINLDLS